MIIWRERAAQAPPPPFPHLSRPYILICEECRRGGDDVVMGGRRLRRPQMLAVIPGLGHENFDKAAHNHNNHNGLDQRHHNPDPGKGSAKHV